MQAEPGGTGGEVYRKRGTRAELIAVIEGLGRISDAERAALEEDSDIALYGYAMAQLMDSDDKDHETVLQPFAWIVENADKARIFEGLFSKLRELHADMSDEDFISQYGGHTDQELYGAVMAYLIDTDPDYEQFLQSYAGLLQKPVLAEKGSKL